MAGPRMGPDPKTAVEVTPVSGRVSPAWKLQHSQYPTGWRSVFPIGARKGIQYYGRQVTRDSDGALSVHQNLSRH